MPRKVVQMPFPWKELLKCLAAGHEPSVMLWMISTLLWGYSKPKNNHDILPEFALVEKQAHWQTSQHFQCRDGFGGQHGVTWYHRYHLSKGSRFYETMSKLRSHWAYLIFQLVILGLERLKASAEMTLKKAESKDLGNSGCPTGFWLRVWTELFQSYSDRFHSPQLSI